MDLFSPLLPRTGYINSLPPFYLIVRLDIIFYLTAGFAIILLLRGYFELIGKIVLSVWLLTSLLYLIQTGTQLYFESKVFAGKSLEELRDLTTGEGYYSFLKFAQKDIPPNEPVTLYLPGNSTYLLQKSPYYLYPHPITDDASYILVFKTKDVDFNRQKGQLTINGEKVISNIQLFKDYSPDAYVIVKK